MIDFVLVPIAEDLHWSLAIVCFPHGGRKRIPEAPTVAVAGCKRILETPAALCFPHGGCKRIPETPAAVVAGAPATELTRAAAEEGEGKEKVGGEVSDEETEEEEEGAEKEEEQRSGAASEVEDFVAVEEVLFYKMFLLTSPDF
ncbi:hypothetical protein T492DRAFT_844716 [Pavlovales sp. CCMP2436]|nr:hypothetical protein T492DRAFT_844716 [Pavlovales sp. CCMP2436]